MSVTLKSGEKIAALKQGIEGVTGETYADLTEAVNGLKEQQFEAGKKAEYDAFWDSFQNNGERAAYGYAFAFDGWNDESFCPKYDLNTNGTAFMFAYNGYQSSKNRIVDVKGCLEKAGVTLDTSGAKIMNNMFYVAISITRVPTISFESMTQCDGLFFSCSQLVNIDKLIFKSDGTTNLTGTPFSGCSRLKGLTVEGVIGRNLSFSSSPLLTAESMNSIISHLANYKGTDNENKYTIKFHDTAWATLEATTPPEGYATWKDYVMDLGWNI